jgi:hypothetical protein
VAAKERQVKEIMVLAAVNENRILYTFYLDSSNFTISAISQSNFRLNEKYKKVKRSTKYIIEGISVKCTPFT